jgi:hypothetical protein
MALARPTSDPDLDTDHRLSPEGVGLGLMSNHLTRQLVPLTRRAFRLRPLAPLNRCAPFARGLTFKNNPNCNLPKCFK